MYITDGLEGLGAPYGTNFAQNDGPSLRVTEDEDTSDATRRAQEARRRAAAANQKKAPPKQKPQERRYAPVPQNKKGKQPAVCNVKHKPGDRCSLPHQGGQQVDLRRVGQGPQPTNPFSRNAYGSAPAATTPKQPGRNVYVPKDTRQKALPRLADIAAKVVTSAKGKLWGGPFSLRTDPKLINETWVREQVAIAWAGVRHVSVRDGATEFGQQLQSNPTVQTWYRNLLKEVQVQTLQRFGGSISVKSGKLPMPVRPGVPGTQFLMPGTVPSPVNDQEGYTTTSALPVTASAPPVTTSAPPPVVDPVVQQQMPPPLTWTPLPVPSAGGGGGGGGGGGMAPPMVDSATPANVSVDPMVDPAASSVPATPVVTQKKPNWLLIGGAALAAYLLLRK